MNIALSSMPLMRNMNEGMNTQCGPEVYSATWTIMKFSQKKNLSNNFQKKFAESEICTTFAVLTINDSCPVTRSGGSDARHNRAFFMP